MPTLKADSFVNYVHGKLDWAEHLWLEHGGTERFYSMGPVRLRVRFLGSKLADLMRGGLAHAEVTESSPEQCTVYALDSTAMQVEKPPSEWIFVTETRDHCRRAHWDPEHGVALTSDETHGIWNCFDVNQRCGLYWIGGVDSLPDWEPGAPFRLMINWAGTLAGAHLVHTAAVDFDGVGALMTGIGGSGKSTTTTAAVSSGFRTAGDDFVLIDQDKEGWQAHAVYDTVKLTGMALDCFSDYTANAENPQRSEDEKARVLLSRVCPQGFVKKVRPSCILTLTVGNRPKTLIRRVSPAAAMMALAPSTLYLLRIGVKESFPWLGQLSRQLPCFAVQLGEDPLEAVKAIAEVVKGSQEDAE